MPASPTRFPSPPARPRIHLAFRMLDAEPGREVWTSSLTFIGGVGPIAYERLTPVFLD